MCADTHPESACRDIRRLQNTSAYVKALQLRRLDPLSTHLLFEGLKLEQIEREIVAYIYVKLVKDPHSESQFQIFHLVVAGDDNLQSQGRGIRGAPVMGARLRAEEPESLPGQKKA